MHFPDKIDWRCAHDDAPLAKLAEIRCACILPATRPQLNSSQTDGSPRKLRAGKKKSEKKSEKKRKEKRRNGRKGKEGRAGKTIRV